MKPRIVNIINFVRGCEPRRYVDLFEPVFHQVRLGKEFGLPTTFLLQYDALIQERFSGFLKEELSENDEVGGWWEIMQPLVEKAGMKWRGRSCAATWPVPPDAAAPTIRANVAGWPPQCLPAADTHGPSSAAS